MQFPQPAGAAQPVLAMFRIFSGQWKSQAFVQLVAILVHMARAIMTISGFNMEWNVDKVRLWNVTVCPQLHIELVATSVVSLGILLMALYTVSILNCLYWLCNVQQQKRDNILAVRQMWCRLPNILVLGATAVSVMDAVWLFLFVREVWTNRLEVAWQVLHMVPTLFVIMETICSGLLICAMSLLDEHQQAALPRGYIYSTDVRTHKGLNILLAMYAIINVVVAQKCQGPDSTYITTFVPLIAALETVCRNIIVYYFGSSKLQFVPEAAEEQVLEPDNPNPLPQAEALRPDVDQELDSDNSDVSGLGSYDGGCDDCIEYSQACFEDVRERYRTAIIYFDDDSVLFFNAHCGDDVFALSADIELEN